MPARIPFALRARSIPTQSFGNSRTNSLKWGLAKRRLTPGTRVSRSDRVGRLLDVLPGQIPKALLAHGLQVNGRPEGAEGLVRADVGRGLLPTDVLFPGGQSQDEAPLSIDVGRLSGDAAGKLADEILHAGHESEVGPAEAQRDPEGLPLAGHDVRAELARGLEEAKGEGFGNDDGQESLPPVDSVGRGLDILADAEVVGRLEDERRGLRIEHPGQGGLVEAAGALIRHFFGPDPQVPDVGPDDALILGMQGGRNEHFGPVLQPVGHQDGLGRPRGPLVEGRVGDIHAGQLADQGLVLENGLEGPLAHLGLVGGVRRYELAPRAQVVHDRRDEMVISPASEEG